MTARTFKLLEASGGRGYWSNALERFAEEVEHQPEATIVSLDWGFHPPLMMLTENPQADRAFLALPPGWPPGPRLAPPRRRRPCLPGARAGLRSLRTWTRLSRTGRRATARRRRDPRLSRSRRRRRVSRHPPQPTPPALVSRPAPAQRALNRSVGARGPGEIHGRLPGSGSRARNSTPRPTRTAASSRGELSRTRIAAGSAATR